MPFPAPRIDKQDRNNPLLLDDECPDRIKIAIIVEKILADGGILVTATYREATTDPKRIRKPDKDQKRNAKELLNVWRFDGGAKNTEKKNDTLRLDRQDEVQIEGMETCPKDEKTFVNYQLQINGNQPKPTTVAQVIVQGFMYFNEGFDVRRWRELVSAGLKDSLDTGATVWVFQQCVDPKTKKIQCPRRKGKK